MNTKSSLFESLKYQVLLPINIQSECIDNIPLSSEFQATYSQSKPLLVDPNNIPATSLAQLISSTLRLKKPSLKRYKITSIEIYPHPGFNKPVVVFKAHVWL